MINPGTQPIEHASEDHAAANLIVFLAAVQTRTVELDEAPVKRRVADFTGEPVRDPAADRDGRFGWDLPFTDGTVVRLLMPGVEIGLLRDDITASAPCLYVNGNAWWWNDAVGSVASNGLVLNRE